MKDLYRVAVSVFLEFSAVLRHCFIVSGGNRLKMTPERMRIIASIVCFWEVDSRFSVLFSWILNRRDVVVCGGNASINEFITNTALNIAEQFM